MSSNFSESVLIPYSLFRKCHLDVAEDNRLTDESLPVDVKLKLFNQDEKLREVKEKSKAKDKPKPNDTKEYGPEGDTSFIVDLMPEKHQPAVSSILKKIKARSAEIGWNRELEVYIDSQLYSGSNIIELLKFVTKSLIITSDANIPIAGRAFLQKLHDIGVPKSWIKATIPRQSTRRGRKRAQHLPPLPTDEDTGSRKRARHLPPLPSTDEDTEEEEQFFDLEEPEAPQTGSGRNLIKWKSY